MGTNSPDRLPRAIEALYKKARVDPAFREAFLNDPLAAATRSGLELTPAEVAMLRGARREHLAAITDSTTVRDDEREILLPADGLLKYIEYRQARALAPNEMRDIPVTGIRPSLLPIPGPPAFAALIETILLVALLAALLVALLAALVYGAIRLLS
jgi:hypothetical protein